MIRDSYTRTVRLADTDAAGVVYFARGFSICHEAYEDALEQLGISLQTWLQEREIALPIVHGEIDFFRPLYCGDQLRIDLTPQNVTENTFEIVYKMTSNRYQNQTVIIAKTRHICIDPLTRKRRELPTILSQWLMGKKAS